MNFVKCTLTEMRRRPAKYIIFTVTFSVIFTSLIIGLNMRATVMYAKDQIIDLVGPYYQLSVRNDQDEPQDIQIKRELESTISEFRYVRGINRSKVEYATAADFGTVRDNEGVIPGPIPALYSSLVELTSNSVIMDANLDCSIIDDFRIGDSVLITGNFPTESNPGVLLEERLAEQNQLTVGDSILLTYVNGKEISARVCGIYRTKGTFLITEDNTVGEFAYAWSPYNRIYASLDLAQQLYEIDIEKLPLSVYVDSISHMKKVENEIKALKIDWEHAYELSDMTTTKYGQHLLAAQIEEMTSYSTLTIVYALLIGIILLSLILNLFLQYYIQDAGILIALGSGKARVILQHLFATGMIAAAATLIAALISGLCTNSLIDKLIQDTTIAWGMVGSYQNGLEHTISIVPKWITPSEWGLFILGVALLLAISTLPLLRKLLIYHPRSILTE